MKLLLADDHSLFKDAFNVYIERSWPDATIYQAQDMNDVMKILETRTDIDIVLLDFHMPGMDNLKGLAKIRKKCPSLPVVLMSGLATRRDVEEALAMGAQGYFPKTMGGKAMIEGIEKICAGETYVPLDHNTNEIMASADPAFDDGGQPSGAHAGDSRITAENAALKSLTPRENDVLRHLVQGETNKDIARALDLQVVTVKLHVRSICRKLGVTNRTQAALAARNAGFLS